MSQDMASSETESQTFTTKLWMIYKHNLITVDFEKKLYAAFDWCTQYRLSSIVGFIGTHVALYPAYISLLRSALSMTTLMSGINNLSNKMLVSGSGSVSKDCCLFLVDVC